MTPILIAIAAFLATFTAAALLGALWRHRTRVRALERAEVCYAELVSAAASLRAREPVAYSPRVQRVYDASDTLAAEHKRFREWR